nr:hypothetical protein BaRGS_014444 [Batillaria attramentaria]
MAEATDSSASSERMSISAFFRGKNIFITGVTGFMGKVLLEKLLRSCPDVGTVYVLVRPKKGVQPQDRIKQIMDMVFLFGNGWNPQRARKLGQFLLCMVMEMRMMLFEKVMQDQPGVEAKVMPINGDILESHFGMSSEDQHRVCENVHVVFHSAATVKFDEELKFVRHFMNFVRTNADTSIVKCVRTMVAIRASALNKTERMSHKYFMKNPCNTIARIPNPRFTLSGIRKTMSVIFDHIIPAYLMDAYLRLVGRRPMFVRIQDRLWKAVSTLEFFTTRQWNFHNDNVLMLLNKMSTEDKKTFSFDPRTIDWSQYMENYCLGAKQFVLKEEVSELPKARIALQRLQRIQLVLKVVAGVLLWRYLVKRVPVAHSLWNLLLGWALWIFQKIPMLARSS